MTDTTQVGKAIKRRREEAGLTQEELAARLEVDSQSVSRWETGRIKLGGKRLEEIARALGCTVADLLTDPGVVRDAEAAFNRGAMYALSRVLEAVQRIQLELACPQTTTPPQNGAASIEAHDEGEQAADPFGTPDQSKRGA